MMKRMRQMIIHLFQFILIYLLRELRSADIIKPYNDQIKYDSTSMEIYSYTKSQGLIIIEQDFTGIASHYNNMFVKLESEQINEKMIIKILYVKSQDNNEYEYIFNFSNERIRGHRIPVITQYNNKKTQDQFFGKKLNLFQAQNKGFDIQPSQSDIIGVEVVFDHEIDPSQNQIRIFYCLKAGVYLAKTNLEINYEINFTKFTPLDGLLESTECKSIIKQNNNSVLINSRITCSSTQCIDTTQQFNINLFLQIGGTIRQYQSYYILSTKQNIQYSWRNNLIINYVFDFKKLDKYVLYVLSDVVNKKVLISIRDGTDDSLIFEGELQNITTLQDKAISYNTYALYVYETVKKSNASIVAFCMDSTYNSNLELCIKTTSNSCLFENNSKCLKCKENYFLTEQGQCIQCNSNCNGCINESSCITCFTSYRVPENLCQCVSGRVEKEDNQQQRQLFSLNSNIVEYEKNRRFLQYKQCVCAPDSYENETNICIQCSTFSPFCRRCNKQGCTECEQRFYLENNQCIQCQQNCMSCNKNECQQCDSSYYLNAQKQCSSCNAITPYCEECSITGCSVCQTGYYLSNKQCVKCHANCKNGCHDQNTCYECYTDYRDNQKQCTCIGGRDDLSTGDAPGQGMCECSSKKYWNSQNNICTLCSTSFGSQCNMCSEGSCSECINGYFLNQDQQCEQCNNNCKNGCIDKHTCNDCYTIYRDKNNNCQCMEGRKEYSKPVSRNLMNKIQNNRFLAGTDSCICEDNRIEDNGECVLCSKLFNEPCNSCSLTGCKNCQGGSQPNQSMQCECPINQYYSIQDIQCLDCKSKFPQECKKCSSETCLDCGDINSIYNSGSNICACKKGYYINSRINQSFTCAECKQKYGDQCSECNENQCTNCTSGYTYDAQQQQCVCKNDSAIKNGQCVSCKILYSNFCSSCTASQCTTCSQSDRNPLQNCKCSQNNAIEYNSKCYSCQIDIIQSSNIALSSTFSLNTNCNFGICPLPGSNCFEGKFDISLVTSISFTDNQGYNQQKNKEFLLSNTSSLKDLILPHGDNTIISKFTSKNSEIIIEAKSNIYVSNTFTNLEDFNEKYLSLKKLNLKLEANQILKYLAEILEIQKIQSDFGSKQKQVCNKISQNGSICICKNKNSYFLDCSGQKSSYNDFQLLLIQYSKFLIVSTLNLNQFQKIQFLQLNILISEYIDSYYLSQESDQIDNLIDLIEKSVQNLNDINNLSSLYEERVNQIIQQISGIFSSSSISSSKIQKAIELVKLIQKTTLLTINPFKTQWPKPAPVTEINSDNIKLYQKLLSCPTKKLVSDEIEFQIGNNIQNSNNDQSNENNNNNDNQNDNDNNDIPPKRFLNQFEDNNYQQIQNINQKDIQLKVRTLQSSNCEIRSLTIPTDSQSYYIGISASVYSINPYQKLYQLPYKEQQYEIFSTEFQNYQNQRILLNDERYLQDNVLKSNDQDQLYSLSFKVISINPQDNSQNFNNDQFKCIYLNEESTDENKWQLCKDKYFMQEKRQLKCKCPVKSTYIYDYNNLYKDSSLDQIFSDMKKKQTTLIIIAIIMAAIFVFLIILYALIYKPKHIYNEIAQIGKQEQNMEAKMNNELFYQVKLGESQNINNIDELRNQSNKKQSQQEKQQNLIRHLQTTQQLQSNQQNNINNKNQDQEKNSKFNQNQYKQYDTFGTSVSFQQKKGSLQDPHDNIMTANSRSIFQNPSIFYTGNKQNLQTQHTNLLTNSDKTERKEFLQTGVTERIIPDNNVSREEMNIEENINLNTIKTNNVHTNKELISNVKLQLTHSDENIEVNSKAIINSDSKNSLSQIKDINIDLK